MAENTQEQFWASSFGEEYTTRNKDSFRVPSYIHCWSSILSHTHGIKSVIELGSNVGFNLIAINQLIHDVELSAVEINGKAVEMLKMLPFDISIHHTSILDFAPQRTYDLSFTRGVLIHIAPDDLQRCYELLYNSSSNYIVVNEYYNPTPVEIAYRGHTGVLFKRDFAGDLLDMFPDLRLVAYGFNYHRDPNFPTDDTTWFLLQKEPRQA